jgi:Type II secretion system (T2SS), protein M subtype b
MTISPRDRRALVMLAVGLVAAAVLHFVFSDSPTVSVTSANVSQDSTELARQRLGRLRTVAATVPAREAAMKQVSADLTARERGMIQADTAPQAQAALLEAVRRIGKNDMIDVRGGEFGPPKPFGDYGLVYTTITFECHIEDLVSFLADLSRAPELAAPSEERIVSLNQKDKTVSVRMVMAGVVAKKLVPAKKGLAGF